MDKLSTFTFSFEYFFLISLALSLLALFFSRISLCFLLKIVFFIDSFLFCHFSCSWLVFRMIESIISPYSCIVITSFSICSGMLVSLDTVSSIICSGTQPSSNRSYSCFFSHHLAIGWKYDWCCLCLFTTTSLNNSQRFLLTDMYCSSLLIGL